MTTNAATRRGRHGGRLRTGNPQNRGGPGRPPRTARAPAFAELDQWLPDLDRMAAGIMARRRNGWKALEHLEKIAAMDTVELSDVNLVLRQTVDVIRAKLPTAQADALLAALAPFWKAL